MTQRIELIPNTNLGEVVAPFQLLEVVDAGPVGPRGFQGTQGPQGEEGPIGNGLLGYKSYTPVSDVLIATTTTTLFSDVNAANLAVTFVAPPSGSVLIRFSLMVYSGASTDYFINLRDLNGDVPETKFRPCAGEQLGAQFRSVSIVKSGLNSGEEYTWKLGHARLGPNAVGIYGGPNFGPNVIEVWRI